MKPFRVHQLLPTFRAGDAMSAAALGFQRALRHLGLLGDVFAEEVEPGYDSIVKHAASLAVDPADFVLYHHGIASTLASKVLHLPCRRGLVFHNITPARFYAGTRLEGPLQTGRAQLNSLAGHVDVAIGVSPLNVRELEASGHRDVRLVPLLVEPRRFELPNADEKLMTRLARLARPRLLTVGRVVPHKRIEDVVALHAELRRLAPRAQLLVVGGFDEGRTEFRALKTNAAQVGGVRFLGRVSHAQLVAAYRSADVFVSMSEHEGLGVPLLEAFASDVPVMAFGAAAVPETTGGQGVVFDTKHFAALSEVAHELMTNEPLRARVIQGQRHRLKDFSLDAVAQALAQALPKEPVRYLQSRKRPRVAFVVQRFGEAIVGGAEAHARQVALKLAPHVEIEVFTTCAVDHLSWANELEPGESRDGPLRVRRFPVARVRHIQAFNRLSKALFGRSHDLAEETRWVADQGPVVPPLLSALVAERARFDAVAFFTALYQPAVLGIPLLADRALLVPTAHDEPPMRFLLYADAFEKARRLLCNTPEEVTFIREVFPDAAPADVVGVGIESLEGNAERFRAASGIEGPYLLYVGRMEGGKGVPELVAFHQALVRRFHDAPTLVLAGAGEFKPRGKRVVPLGRIDEQTKWDALAGALAVTVPSRFESLSLLALEAFAAGTPVIGNTKGEVVRGQLERSRAGVGYHDEGSFAEAVRAVGERRSEFSKRAKKYALSHRWSSVVGAWTKAIELVKSSSA